VAGITAAELAAVRGRLEAFAADVFESLPRRDQRARGGCYLRMPSFLSSPWMRR
jgi:hypothetical protein